MGGKATFSGTDFQARVGAFFLAHAIARRSLPPFGVPSGVPAAVAHETGGAGDDIRLELTNGFAHEVQAKHGLKADERLESALDQFAQRLKSGEHGILVVDRATSSSTVTEQLREALERWRNDQEPTLSPGLRERLKPLLDSTRADVRKRIAIAVLDLDDDSGGHAQFALEILRAQMANGNAPEQAWSSLFKIASAAAKKGHKHSRERIIALLAAEHCYIRSEEQQQLEPSASPLSASLTAAAATAPVPIETSPELKIAAGLLRRLQPSAALVALGHAANSASSRHRAEHATLEGVAHLQRDKPEEAIACFERALAEDPTYIPARLNLGTAYGRTGRTESAIAETNHAAKIEPDSLRVWAARIEAASDSPLDVPQAISNDPAVTLARVSNALKRGATVPPALIAQLEQDTIRSPDEHAEYLLLETLFIAAWRSTPLNDDLLRKARALCENLLPRLTDTQLWMRRVVRWRYALILEAGGNVEDALHELRAVANEDPATPAFAISYAEHALRHRRDLDSSLKLIEPYVSTDRFCMALHARLLFVTGREDDARGVLSALVTAALSTDDDELRLTATNAAIELQDAVSARSLLVDDTRDARWQILRARIHVLQGDVDGAFDAYRSALDAAGSLALPIRLECAALLLRSSRWNDVVEILNPLSPDTTDHVKSMLAEACFQLGEYSRATNLAVEAGDLSSWSVRLRAFLAIKKFDTSNAQKLLQRWHELEPKEPAALLWLAHTCIQTSDLRAARATLSKVAVTSLPTLERLKLSRLLLLAGEPGRAVHVAYAALREGFHDTNVLEAFLQVRLAALRHLPHMEQSFAHEGVSVRLRTESGNTLTRLLTSDADPVEEIGETASDGTFGQSVLGKKLGDVVELSDAGDRATIVALGDRTAHAFWWVTEELERRQSPTIKSISLVGPDGAADPSIIFGMMAARDQEQMKVFDLVEDRPLPFSSAAMMLGRSTFDVYSSFLLDTNRLVPVEHVDCRSAVDALTNATGFVVTRTFLATLEALNITDLATKLTRPLFATPALLRALHSEREEHEETSKFGRLAMGIHQGTNRLFETSTDVGKSFLERTHRLIDWIHKNCQVHLPDRVRSRSSQYLKEDANEAIAAAKQLEAALLTDDLGLRCLAAFEFGTQGASTYAVLLLLHQKNELTREDLENLVSHLLEMGHAAIPFTIELALRSLNRDPIRLSSFEIALRHLRAKHVDVGAAALFVSRLVRQIFVDPSLSMRTAGIAQLCFAALLKRRGAVERTEAERLLAHFIAQDFLLFRDERDRMLAQLKRTALEI